MTQDIKYERNKCQKEVILAYFSPAATHPPLVKAYRSVVGVSVFPLSRREPHLNTPPSFVPGYVCGNGVKNPEWWLRLRVISGHFAEFLNGFFVEMET
jgi:hypothetical protein